MTLGLIAFFAAFGLLSGGLRTVLAALWLAFVATWVVLLRRGRRAQPRPKRWTRRDVLEWVALFVAANVITVVASRVSWALVGISLALFGAGYGAISAWRSRRA